MPASTKKPEGPLAASATAFEDELRRYEDAVIDLERLQVVSEKSLQRARRVLEGCAEHQGELAKHLQALALAMQASQERQQKCVEATAAAANRIKARFDQRSTLLERVARLGQQAREINEPVAAAMDNDRAATESEATTALLGTLQEIGARTEAVIAEAEAVQSAAKDGEWLDIERDTDALRQQLQAARNKVLLTQRNLASRAPS